MELTQQEFAKRIGTTQNVLANYESGRRNPSASVVNNICKTFGVRESWLRRGEGDMLEQQDCVSLDELLDRCDVAASERKMVSALVKTYFSLKPETRQDILEHFFSGAEPSAPFDRREQIQARREPFTQEKRHKENTFDVSSLEGTTKCAF